ncbi:hypothetical protein ACLOJK_030370 [Asimina triloba]
MPHERYLQSLTEFTPPPPPPPFLPPFKTQQPSSSSGHGVNPSIIIIVLILVLVFLISASLHFILRYIDRVRRPPYAIPTTSPPSPPNTHQPLVNHNHQRHAAPSDLGQALVDSLPSFSFDSIAAFQKSSAPDCAVCLSRFESGDQLRFLPACCHAFHARCIDVWLASNRTCPLCRSTIHVPFDSAKTSVSGNGSESFRIEVGSVSRRRAAQDSSAGSGRSYSMGSFDYIIDDDLAAEVVVAAATAHSRGLSSGGVKEETEPAAPGVDVAEAAGGGSSGRGWLRDYVDRLTASASSSFSSSRAMSFRMRGSGGGGSSRRSEAGAAGGGGSWDVGDEAGSFFRWLVGDER